MRNLETNPFEGLVSFFWLASLQANIEMEMGGKTREQQSQKKEVITDGGWQGGCQGPRQVGNWRGYGRGGDTGFHRDAGALSPSQTPLVRSLLTPARFNRNGRAAELVPNKQSQQEKTNRMKHLSVVVAGTGQIRDVDIQPGTTAGDILNQLSLKDYLLSKGPNDPFFAAAESVYDKINDGEKIFASTKAEVGLSACA